MSALRYVTEGSPILQTRGTASAPVRDGCAGARISTLQCRYRLNQPQLYPGWTHRRPSNPVPSNFCVVSLPEFVTSFSPALRLSLFYRFCSGTSPSLPPSLPSEPYRCRWATVACTPCRLRDGQSDSWANWYRTGSALVKNRDRTVKTFLNAALTQLSFPLTL